MNPPLFLRELSFTLRAGLTGVVLVLVLGLWASLDHLRTHHAPRDQQAGFSLDDLRASYHGIHAPARLAEALNRGHPAELPDSERTLLRTWLAGPRVAEDYDSPDQGEHAPAEILAARCVTCHARKLGSELPLDTWNDVKQLAFARDLDPTPLELVITSLHAHATSMALLTLAVMALVFCTRWPASLRGCASMVGGLALLADLASWFLARSHASFVLVIASAGAVWSLWMALALALVLLELWLPEKRRS